MESLSYIEETKRIYSNGVSITYEYIDNENLYIHSIISTLKLQGNATKSLMAFIDEFNDKNIYIFASSELGTDVDVLNKWYEKIGFKKVNNLDKIPYNVTHIKIKNI